VISVNADKRHSYQDGDYVRFNEVEGMIELNSLPPTPIEVINGFKFKVKVDATNFNQYAR
jgi:hypothetical protein